jgi:hypothetical protein
VDLTTHARPLKMVHEETENARVDINFSDRLSDSTKPLFIVKDRITKIFNRLWQANLDDKGSGFQDAELSFFSADTVHSTKRCRFGTYDKMNSCAGLLRPTYAHGKEAVLRRFRKRTCEGYTRERFDAIILRSLAKGHRGS